MRFYRRGAARQNKLSHLTIAERKYFDGRQAEASDSGRAGFPAREGGGTLSDRSKSRWRVMNSARQPVSTADNGQADVLAWKAIVAKYQEPSLWRALWQIIDTVIPYGFAWYLMYLCLSISWWLVVPLAILAGGLLVRVFIIFHDCGHGSFFKSRAANDAVGFIAGIL